jgi:hypothetical protein
MDFYHSKSNPNKKIMKFMTPWRMHLTINILSNLHILRIVFNNVNRTSDRANPGIAVKSINPCIIENPKIRNIVLAALGEL